MCKSLPQPAGLGGNKKSVILDRPRDSCAVSKQDGDANPLLLFSCGNLKSWIYPSCRLQIYSRKGLFDVHTR